MRVMRAVRELAMGGLSMRGVWEMDIGHCRSASRGDAACVGEMDMGMRLSASRGTVARVGEMDMGKRCSASSGNEGRVWGNGLERYVCKCACMVVANNAGI